MSVKNSHISLRRIMMSLIMIALLQSEWSAAESETELSTSSIIERYEAAIAVARRSIMSGELTRTRHNPRGTDSMKTFVEWDRAWDGLRLSTRGKAWKVDEKGDRDDRGAVDFRDLVTPDLGFHIGGALGQPPRRARITRDRAATSAKYNDSVYSNAGGSFLDGFASLGGIGDQSLAELMKKPGTRVVTSDEIFHGEPCKKVTAETNDYRAELWFASQKAFNCVGFTVEHGVIPGFNDEKGQPFRRHRTTLDSVRFDQVSGRWVPIAGRLVTTIERQDGSEIVDEAIVLRKRVQLDPDFDASRAFELTGIPDGCRISVDEAGGSIEFEWRGGKVVPRFDESLIQRIEEEMRPIPEQGRPAAAQPQAKPAPSPNPNPNAPESTQPLATNASGTHLTIIVVAGVVALAAVVAVIVARSRRQTR